MAGSEPALAARFGLAYWAAMFGAGFVLGTLRVLLVVPRLGELLAVLAELPIMLGLCWFVASRLARRWPLSGQASLLAGALAFALLLAAEAATAIALSGQSLQDWASGLWHFPAILGLVAQVLAALFPLLARR